MRSHKSTMLIALMALSKTRQVSAYQIAEAHAALGDADAAFSWLERTYEERPNLMVSLMCAPAWRTLHDDPRFVDLVARIGLWS